MAEMSKGLERANHLEEAVIVLTEVLEKRKKMLRENHPVCLCAHSLIFFCVIGF